LLTKADSPSKLELRIQTLLQKRKRIDEEIQYLENEKLEAILLAEQLCQERLQKLSSMKNNK